MFSPTSLGLDTEPAPAWSQLARWAPHTHGPACSSLPTPLAKDARRGGLTLDALERRLANSRTGPDLNEVLGGPANPEFVEWLMGFPAGWSDVQPSATP